jgi:hypothetical protein
VSQRLGWGLWVTWWVFCAGKKKPLSDMPEGLVDRIALIF